MKILALDPATSTGFAIITIDKVTNDANIEHYGFIDVDNSSGCNGKMCIDIMNQVEQLIKKYDIEVVCVENFFASSKFCSGTDYNYYIRGAIYIKCSLLNLPYHILNISAWKTYVAGRSTPTKEFKKKYGTNAKKIFIVDALWKNWGIRLPNHSISNNTGKPVMFRYDISDVIAQGIYFCKMILKVNNITCSVVIPPDVEFKGKNKLYVYT